MGAAMQLPACGMGTEIGNGFKSDGDGATADKTTKEGAASNPSAAPTVGADTAATPVDSAGVNAPVFDPRVLYTSCATPLAFMTPGTYALAEMSEGKEPVVRVAAEWIDAADQAAYWLVQDADGKALAEVEPPQSPEDASAAVFDPEHEPLADAYGCGALATPTAEELAAGGTLNYAVPLLQNGIIVTTLSWSVLDGKLDHISAGGVTLRPKE
jgi:hypothetical protein